jgi:hypothetical protein
LFAADFESMIWEIMLTTCKSIYTISVDLQRGIFIQGTAIMEAVMKRNL